jgi:hypothetical protein
MAVMKLVAVYPRPKDVDSSPGFGLHSEEARFFSCMDPYPTLMQSSGKFDAGLNGVSARENLGKRCVVSSAHVS